MAWFDFLKEEGFFNPDNNPAPIEVKEGFQIPYWEVLGYLEKLSVQIKEAIETELTGELLAVITNVSEHPKDNYRTWYIFIKILSNLPNENIPLYILDFIPVWLSGRFDTMLQTSEMCDKLLPKFLNDQPTSDDIQKAERILHYLFQVEKAEPHENAWEGEGNSYRSRLYLHFLADKFEKRNLISKVVTYCSSDFILELGRTLKFLLLDYPKGINSLLKDHDKEYEIKIRIEQENLLILSKLKDRETANESLLLSDWETKREDELKQELIFLFQQRNIRYMPTDDNNDTLRRLNFALNTDLNSALGFKGIRELDDKFSNDEKVFSVFSLIFRDLLDEKAKQNPEEAIALLKIFCYDNKYRIPFYKRIALYVISENWAATKPLFWELIKDRDALHLFSKYQYQKELYELLSRNGRELEEKEKKILLEIIEQGEQEDSYKKIERHGEYWQLRWYAALKDVAPFTEKYTSLSELLNITHDHYDNLGKIRWRSGSVSPVSKEELLEKSNTEIAAYIKAFKPKDNWEEPTVSGLSEAFGNAVELQPEKFANEIELYENIPYNYSYRMLNAFGEAWKKQKSFDCQKVLTYCLATLQSPQFYSGKLASGSPIGDATPDWVTGSIALLITEGYRDDGHAFGTVSLPVVKDIIRILVSNLVKADAKETNLDYPTYSLNSTGGKSLRALLDYSLYRARHLFQYEDKEKWEPDVKLLFEEALQKEILDANILEGMYFEQFYFLDKEWITEQVKKQYGNPNREWLAFIGGFIFGNPPFNQDIYNLFYPHYVRTIDNGVKLKTFHNNGLVRHLTAFYFWHYETLSDEKLLYKFLHQSDPASVRDLITFISRQEEYQKSLSETEQLGFQQIILDLWMYLADKYEHSSDEEKQKNLALLMNWMVFIPELTDTYTKLTLKSVKHTHTTYSTHQLLDNLVLLRSKGIPTGTAIHIGEIMSSMSFKEYLGDEEKESIRSLVSFLYSYGQRETAAAICNQLAYEYQQLFLRDIFEENL